MKEGTKKALVSVLTVAAGVALGMALFNAGTMLYKKVAG